jgi:hypothetical protein
MSAFCKLYRAHFCYTVFATAFMRWPAGDLPLTGSIHPPCEVLIGVDYSALHQCRQLRHPWQELLVGATRAGRAVDPDPHDPSFDWLRTPVTNHHGHRYGTRF